MKLLVLGGTVDARILTQRLYECESGGLFSLIYSVAGLVRTPCVPARVISGGFKVRGGLLSYLKAESIQGVLDATHPYAVQMTCTAVQACGALGIPYWRFQRPSWVQEAGDIWETFSDWPSLISALAGYRHVFFSAGQLPKDISACLAERCPPAQTQLIRTAAPLQDPSLLARMPTMTWVKGVGPFTLEAELELLARHQIDCVISKDSGGDATYAKIQAARQRSVPVKLLARPSLPPAIPIFDTIDGCINQVLNHV